MLDDAALGPLTDDRLTRDVRVFQRKKGHRFSSDDVATAYVALGAAPGARTVLDLGCGLGSVLLHLAWSLPEARLVGVEAQELSFELLSRNVARNAGFPDRVRIHHGDLRDEAVIARLASGFEGGFALITGTPPYFPPETALDAEDMQRAYARIEYRGGVEAYVATGARLLAPDGVMVMCGDARAEHRVASALATAGLCMRERCVIVPREGRPPLFAVWTLRREPGAVVDRALMLRDAEGNRTPDAQMLKAFSGFA